MIANLTKSLGFSIVLVLLGGSNASGQLVQAAVSIKQIEEVIAGFHEAQHLYVQGEIGVSPGQLAALEAWLDTNGPHWTIVLMQRSADQVYSAPDGRTFSGMDAVEFALGHGLANRTPFGRLEHPSTGETDGAAFVLFLEDRKFSYYGSDAQDRRGIGEAQWIGDLDRNARVAMQNGGRIIDAVKNTVNEINGRLAQCLANEEQEKRDRIAEAERISRERALAVTQVRADIAKTRSRLLPEVESLAGTFLSNFPEASGSVLARPPVHKWNTELNIAENDLQENNSRQTSQTLSKIVAEIHRQLDYYGAHTAFEQTIAPLQQRWQTLTLHHYASAAESHANAVQQLLRQARSEHLSGNPAFISTIEKVRTELDLGDKAIIAAAAEFEQYVARKQIIRQTILYTLGIVFAVVASLLLFLHRRRRPALAEAQALLSENRQRLQKEQASIDAVAVRKKALIETSELFAKRGKMGETLSLAQRIETDCNLIQSLMNAAMEPISRAAELIEPASLWIKTLNLFSPSRYLEGRNLLAGRSFKIPSVSSDASETNVDEPALPATFDDFESYIVTRRQATDNALDQLERCTMIAGPSVIDIEAKCVSVDERMRVLAIESKKDGYLAIPDLEAKLLPSIRRLIDRGKKMKEIDPVYVVESLCPDANRQVIDATECVSLATDVRAQNFPVFDELADKLKSLQHRVQWIEEHVVDVGERLNQLMEVACDEDITGSLTQLKLDVKTFLTKLREITQIADVTIRDRLTEVEATRQSLAEARLTIAKSLSISASEAISEESLNPDEHLRSAESAINASRVAVDMGSLDDAKRAAKAAQEETRYAKTLIDESLACNQEFASSHSQLCKELDHVAEMLTDVTQVVKVAEQTYAPEALVWHNSPERTADPGDLNDDLGAWEAASFATGEPASVQVESADRIVDSIRSGLEAAPADHAVGKLLHAANVLRFAREGIAESKKRLQLADQHCKRVDAIVPANVRRANILKATLEKWKVNIDDLRTESSTQQIYQQLNDQLRQLSDELERPVVGRNPFEDTNKLLNKRNSIVELRSLITADFAAFAEAKRAVEGALRELVAVDNLAMQSIEDQVPDSDQIAECQREVRRLISVVTDTEAALKIAHNDWQAVQKNASDATAELGLVSGSLRQELQLAEEATSSLRAASAAVVRASRWTCAYGITISETHGSDELEQARTSLANGDYSSTITLSKRAKDAAESAIEEAEEYERRWRQKEEEAAAARSRALQQSIFNAKQSSSSSSSWSSSSWSSGSSSSSSWSSGSSSRSSYSSPARSSSSSSSSSGGSSGFSRSGW